MLALHGGQALTGQLERVVPADFLPLAPLPQQRTLQPIGVCLQIEDRIAFRADVALTERVGIVPTNCHEPLRVELEFQAADRFAQWARTEA
ncbi:MAG TPA: hypothetical protein VFK72_01070, partial [Nevskia sp.]|nr:hypothetical protein [Nevskia sp.]